MWGDHLGMGQHLQCHKSIQILFFYIFFGMSIHNLQHPPAIEAQRISCRSAFTLATLWFVLHTELLKDPGQVQADCLVNYGIMPCGAWRLEDTWPNMAQPSTGNSHDKIDTQLYCSCTACRAHGLKLVGHLTYLLQIQAKDKEDKQEP